jgi:toxin ParE1/3/4
MDVSYADGVFEELVEISFYLSNADESIAQSFLNACNETFQNLAQNRYLGTERKFNDPRLSNIRMWRVKGYEKFLIFYVPTEDGIKVLHIVHSSTDYGRTLETDL